MKISFDFDGTLELPRIQEIAKTFIKAGHDVYITTSRNMTLYDKYNEEIYIIAHELGIPDAKVRFTNDQPKYLFLKGFDVHYDNDIVELEDINRWIPDCKTIFIE